MTTQPSRITARLVRWGDRCRLRGVDAGLGTVLERSFEAAGRGQLGVMAGNIAFRLMLALLPGLITVIWLLRLLGTDALVEGFLNLARLAFPGPAIDPIEEQVVNAPPGQASGSLSLGVAVSSGAFVWAGALTFQALIKALNQIYAVEETRSGWVRMFLGLAASVAGAALLLTALVLIVWGSEFADRMADGVGHGVSFRATWAVASWTAILVCIVAAFSVTAYVAPDVQQSVRWVRVGTLVAVALWLAFSVAFSLYVNVLARPDDAYGHLAGVAIFMLYLYGSVYAYLLGAVVNQVIESCAPSGKNTGERQRAEPLSEGRLVGGNAVRPQ